MVLVAISSTRLCLKWGLRNCMLHFFFMSANYLINLFWEMETFLLTTVCNFLWLFNIHFFLEKVSGISHWHEVILGAMWICMSCSLFLKCLKTASVLWSLLNSLPVGELPCTVFPLEESMWLVYFESPFLFIFTSVLYHVWVGADSG